MKYYVSMNCNMLIQFVITVLIVTVNTVDFTLGHIFTPTITIKRDKKMFMIMINHLQKLYINAYTQVNLNYPSKI